MPYIARTGSTPELLEIREGTLTDIPEAERAQWLTVQESSAGLDPITQVRAGFQIAVNQMGDQVQLIHQSVTMPPAWRRMRLKQIAADRRWKVETGGCVWNGWPVETTREARANMLAEFVAIGGGLRVDGELWKFSDGISRPLTNVEFQSMALAARDHVKAAFAAERAIVVEIDADTIVTVAAIDAYPWP